MLTAAACSSVVAATTPIPASYAMPAGSVTTTAPGFRVRPYQTSASHGGNLVWAEDQLSGLHGPNLADLSGADAQGYYLVNTVVNFNQAVGSTVDNFPGGDAFPGIGNAGVSDFTDEALTYVQFPTAGTYTMGVNSDDGFEVSVAQLNPKDRASAISLGKSDGTHGSQDTTFDFSISQPGIYPFRLVYFQASGGANVSWFSVVTTPTSTNFVLLNDTSTTGALNTYATASIAPPYATAFVSSPAGFSFTIVDDVSALVPASVQVTLNGAPISVTPTKVGTVTTITYATPVLFPPLSSNTIAVQFSDNAVPAHNLSATFRFVVPAYTTMPPSAALAASGVDLTKRGFLYRMHQIDSGNGILAANVAHAEAQLAGLLQDAFNSPYPDNSAPGPLPGGLYVVTNVINFGFNPTPEQGAFTTANGYPDEQFPGAVSTDSINMAGEIVAYLDLKPGFYNFGINATDGFRVIAAQNPYDALGTTLGLFDFRAILTETRFGVAVQNAGIYPIRLVWYRMNKGSNGGNGEASLEFYTINTDGSKVLVNDTNTTAVKAYWNRTASYPTYVKYAGPSSFVSPFGDSSDVGFKTVDVQISNGSSTQVNPASVVLSVDGTVVKTGGTQAGGITTVSYSPTNTQLPRMTHSASLVYAETGGVRHTNNWNFHLLRNYVFPAPVYFEDFESTPAGPTPTVPAGWVEENHTHATGDPGLNPADLDSDFYLGWVVVDTSFNIRKDLGLSQFSPQEFNGVLFDEGSNPLLVNHYLRAETDSQTGDAPGQIQFVTTKGYDLTGKTGIVIAFNSAFEQNQDSINGVEYTLDNGATWNPILYWIQGDFDSGGPSDIFRDGLGNIDVAATLLTFHTDAAIYTNSLGQVIGGNYGGFVGAPITPALAPYIEGRYNDDGKESKRIEAYRVPLADGKPNVKFRFMQAGTSSWYWALDNFGVYSVPSLVSTQLGSLAISRTGTQISISWSGAGVLYSATDLTGQWSIVDNATSPYSASASGQRKFYRLQTQ
jgi:hypothetical protein